MKYAYFSTAYWRPALFFLASEDWIHSVQISSVPMWSEWPRKQSNTGETDK